MTDAERKAACRQVMFSHLEERGYPNIDESAILDELPAMWEKLTNAGLMPEGFYYADFERLALGKAIAARLSRMFRRP